MTSPVAPILPPPAPISPLPPPPQREPAASLRTQAATFASCAIALMIATTVIGVPVVGILASAALGVGVVIANLTEVANLFRTFPAMAAAVLTGVAASLLVFVAYLGGAAIPDPWLWVLLPAMAVFGLDWTRLDRVRLVPIGVGVAVVVAVVSEKTWVYPAALTWLAVVLVAMWLAELDRRAALARVRPLDPGEEPPARPADLVVSLVVAIGVALVAALVLSVPSCSGPPRGGVVPQPTNTVPEPLLPDAPELPDVPPPERSADPSVPWWAIAVAVAIGIAVLAALWLRRRPPRPPAPPAPPWAIALAARLADEGRARGAPRGPTTTVHEHGRRFGTVIGDGRVPEVADVVSAALFARRDPGPEVQRWAESTLEAVVADHPETARRAKRVAGHADVDQQPLA